MILLLDMDIYYVNMWCTSFQLQTYRQSVEHPRQLRSADENHSFETISCQAKQIALDIT